MEIIRTINELRNKLNEKRVNGKTIGFVPTMGYLHEGHLSLIERSSKENDVTVVSVFVNPIQFGPSEDLDKYPRDLSRDEEVATKGGADYIFAPTTKEMYDGSFSTYVEPTLTSVNLCGVTRPTHFRGVCTVVLKLFNIVKPNKAYFGQKDAQQLATIKRMVTDLNVDIEIIGCPIIREADGLAKSSRNVYLSNEERQAALILSKSLKIGKELINDGLRDSKKLVEAIKNNIESEKLARIDYVEVVDNNLCQSIEVLKGEILVAIAVYIGNTRLIDNFIMNVEV